MGINPIFFKTSQSYVHIGHLFIPRMDLCLIVLFWGILIQFFNQVFFNPEQRKRWVRATLFFLLLSSIPAVHFFRNIVNGTLSMNSGEFKFEPLEEASYHGDLETTKKLLQAGASIRPQIQGRKSALHFACGATPVINQEYKGSPEVAEYLISQGADVNAQDGGGNTPLMDAIANHNLECVKILLSHGADIQLRSKFGSTAIDLAQTYRDEAILQALRAPH